MQVRANPSLWDILWDADAWRPGVKPGRHWEGIQRLPAVMAGFKSQPAHLVKSSSLAHLMVGGASSGMHAVGGSGALLEREKWVRWLIWWASEV
jgi:hypothetical protein